MCGGLGGVFSVSFHHLLRSEKSDAYRYIGGELLEKLSKDRTRVWRHRFGAFKLRE